MSDKIRDYFLDPIFVRALQPFAPAARAECPAKLHEHTYVTDCGLTLSCDLDFSFGERGAREVGTKLQLEPDTVDTATLISAWVGPYDIAPVLAFGIVDAIEADFLRARAWD